jgi:hypothetical protein
VKLETVLRVVPGIAAIVGQAFPMERNTVYAPMYATHVVALVGTIKDFVRHAPGPVRAVLETAGEYHKVRVLFYLLLALKFHFAGDGGSGGWSFLDLMLMLECPLCARIVAHARAGS